MPFRSVSIFAMAVVGFLGVAHAAPNDAPISYTPDTSAKLVPSSPSGYRLYVKAQADLLVGMTKVLALEVKDGNLDAARAVYAPAHRYLRRIEPIVEILHDLHQRMDARPDAYANGEFDTRLSGFHRIEYGLFTNGSTKDLSAYADRLYKDSRELQQRIMLVEITPDILTNILIRRAKDIADTGLSGDEERYSRTDLWDVEADMDGTREIIASLQSQVDDQNKKRLTQAGVQFAKFYALLEKHKDGCGFKNFNEISEADKSALRGPVTALASELSLLRSSLAIN